MFYLPVKSQLLGPKCVVNVPGITGLPNSFRSRPGHIDRHFIYTAICVKTTLAQPTEKLECQKWSQLFQVPIKTRPFSAGQIWWSYYRTIPFQNRGLCVRAVRCHQGMVNHQDLQMIGLKLTLILLSLIYLNFHPLEVVSRYRDPQLEVGENYLYLFNLSTNICKFWCVDTHFINVHSQ